MNLDQHPTPDQLKEIIASVDDNRDSHILYVTKNGDVHLTPFSAETAAGAEYADESTLQFVLDTFILGNGFTGQQASNDQEWMDELLSGLTEHWASKTTGFAWEPS